MTSSNFIRVPLAVTALALALSGMTAVAGAAEDQERGRDSRMLQRIDTNGDGIVSLEEFQTAGNDAFQRLDADADGRIDREEFAAAHRGRHYHQHRGDGERGQGPAGKPADPPSEEQRAERMARMEQVRAARFESMDKDNDGAVSESEFHELRMAHFKARDADQDGALSGDELAAHRMGRGQD
jgi:Ca2+-binding EF-hand superfamily protein